MGRFITKCSVPKTIPLPMLRELYLMYTKYAAQTKERLAEIENHMRIIVEKAMKPI